MSQTTRTLIALREMILNGELTAGERLREVALAKRLNTSRTPVHVALVKLAEEGLLEKVSTVGYVVREFTLRDVEDAIEMRGTVEGVAARFSAERGIAPAALERMRAIVQEIDTLLNGGNLSNDDEIERYLELNGQFHEQLRHSAESFVIEHLYARIGRLPFASPNAFVIAQSLINQTNTIFQIGNAHHRAIVEAIAKRQGARAEHLAREHARLSLEVMTRTDTNHEILTQVRGSQLIAMQESNGTQHTNGVTHHA